MTARWMLVTIEAFKLHGSKHIDNTDFGVTCNYENRTCFGLFAASGYSTKELRDRLRLGFRTWGIRHGLCVGWSRRLWAMPGHPDQA